MKNFIQTIFNKYRNLTIAFVALLVIAPFAVQALQPKTDEVEEQTVAVTKGNVSVSLSIDGKSILDKRELSFEIAGVVRGVAVKEGDLVAPWQTLAYLDTREAQKNLELKMRDYLSTRNDFDEMGQVTYQEEIDNSVVDDTIRRILEKNQWSLEQAVLDVELRDLAVRKSYLSSPIAGVVAQIDLKPGELASTSKLAVTVVDTTSLVLEGYLEDIEALKVEPGMQVRVEFEALPDNQLMGQVSYLSPIATLDENDLAMYRVLVELDEHDVTLLDGMSAEFEIISKEATDVLKIPNSAVKRVDGSSVVYQRVDGELVMIPVELGFTNGKEVEVKSGLKVGDTVIDWK